VVEDNLDSQELLCTIMRISGAESRGASSAEEALQIMRTFVPELLISDIGLPGLDGYGLIARIRALPSDRGGCVPAIALTAFAQPEDRDRALWSGFQAHLTKPVDPDDLLRSAGKLLHRPAQQAA
jgi:CheY-like chemotaxis protein